MFIGWRTLFLELSFQPNWSWDVPTFLDVWLVPLYVLTSKEKSCKSSSVILSTIYISVLGLMGRSYILITWGTHYMQDVIWKGTTPNLIWSSGTCRSFPMYLKDFLGIVCLCINQWICGWWDGYSRVIVTIWKSIPRSQFLLSSEIIDWSFQFVSWANI